MINISKCGCLCVSITTHTPVFVNMGSVPGLGRSPEGGNGNPLQYSCLGKPMDRGAIVGDRAGGCKRVMP